MKRVDEQDPRDFRFRGAATSLLALAIALGFWSRGRRDDQDDSRAAPLLIIDPNCAPLEVFSALPRLGPSHLLSIDSARRRKPFRSLDDFDLRVKGVGSATIQAIKKHFVFRTKNSRSE
ncbi:MAG: hypothetical protein NVSMB14_17940 [Isosphaeraceae bacterium]